MGEGDAFPFFLVKNGGHHSFYSRTPNKPLIILDFLLAGFNIPVSEDGMLFISALLASKSPQNFYQLFLRCILVPILVTLFVILLGAS